MTTAPMDTTVEELKQFIDNNCPPNRDDTVWEQGYISALVGYDIITEDQFNELLEWLISIDPTN